MKADNRSFVEKWTINGKDLIEQGIYEWASEMLDPYSRILEVGCGTGHSTLLLVTMGHKVFAIDNNNECIVAANDTLSMDWDSQITKEFIMADVDATFMCADFFSDDVMTHLQGLSVDAIIIWQPGQVSNTVDIIDRCVAYAKRKELPIQVLERANSRDEGQMILSDIADDNNIRLVKSDIMESNWNQSGVRLLDIKEDTVYFAVGLFYPY